MPRALVTGASGFVGGALAAELARAGYEVTALVRSSSARGHLEALGATFASGDLSDKGALSAAVAGADVVHHVAAVVRARDPRDFERSNVAGTRLLLEACAARAGGPPRVVLVSSLAAAGPSRDGRPVTEESPPAPITAYGRSKLAQEQLAAEFAGRVPVVTVRPPAVYGPRDAAFLVMFKLARWGVAPRLVGGTERTSMVHVEDLAVALRLAGERGAPGGVYFATDGAEHDAVAVAQAMARAQGRRAVALPVPLAAARMVARLSQALTPPGRTPVVNPEKIADLSQRWWICSDARARRDLGYSSRWDLEAGLEQTARWYRAEGWLG